MQTYKIELTKKEVLCIERAFDYYALKAKDDHRQTKKRLPDGRENAPFGSRLLGRLGAVVGRAIFGIL